MLSIYLELEKRTRRMVRFVAGSCPGHPDSILYLDKTTWGVMGRPTRVVVEVTPEEDYTA